MGDWQGQHNIWFRNTGSAQLQGKAAPYQDKLVAGVKDSFARDAHAGLAHGVASVAGAALDVGGAGGAAASREQIGVVGITARHSPLPLQVRHAPSASQKGRSASAAPHCASLVQGPQAPLG